MVIGEDFRWFIARRHLVSRKRFSLISVITGIALFGITIGSALLIIVMSVMNGFFEVVRDLLISFEPHIRIESVEARGIFPSDSLFRSISSLNAVRNVEPYVEGKALLSYQTSAEVNKVVIARGIDFQSPEVIQTFQKRLVMGSLDLSRTPGGKPGILISEQLGNRLGLFPAEKAEVPHEVALLSAEWIERLLTRPFVSSSPVFEVRGWYRAQGIYDESYVFLDIHEAQRLFLLGNRVSGMELWLYDPDQAQAVKDQLQHLLDPSRYRIQTWYERHQALYRVMRMEKWGATAILLLIVLVAAFNIVGSLTMLTIEKRRDIGILRAMGVSRKDIRKIFLLEGLLIGGSGAGAGITLGLILAWWQKTYQLVPLAGAESFIIDAYPVAIELLDVVLVGGIVFFLSLLASLYPAYRAAAIEPVRVIQETA